ncbi:MAG TPA: ribosome biogenesis GTPase YlqF [Bacilli bacterium]|nr:MAG: Ribosome biogenesis GTPase A [Tenericutes bacterium ADurb.BinA124]HNZ50949.1 ribosome biogenesis GTPase YlqF [Bacilli bacterium]HPN61241.1 ribosome biogenesis GTPase YlqF [Bacilli bacterium]HPX83970.1 ribosome biogenesis GTPase YlqF [Bacilli bacterium]HQC74310.1 ribosome biogenesis GTPase YlqF [Bacilli bacterium]
MIQWYPGHMAKAKKDIEARLRVIDIIFELVDARIPFSSKNPMIASMLANKPKLLLLTKADLADAYQSKKWAHYYEREGYQVLAIDALSGLNVKRIGKWAKEVLADKLAKEKAKGLLERPLRAMIVGIPNVGKSTLINTLVKRKTTMVGNKPGVTKAQQWVRVNPQFDLLDTPGVLWPKFDDEKVGLHLALAGAIKDEVLDVFKLGEYLIAFLGNHYPQVLWEKWEITSPMTFDAVLEQIAKKNGFIKTDYQERVLDLIIKEFRSGRLGRITLDRFAQFKLGNPENDEL